MEVLVGALAVITVCSTALSVWSLIRAAEAREQADSAMRISTRRDDWDRVEILPNGQVRVIGLRDRYVHAVILGKPDKGKS